MIKGIENQRHLNRRDAVNLGSYYTPKAIVDILFGILQKNIPDLGGGTILDSSCGYGSFLYRNGFAHRLIGADIDIEALGAAEKRNGAELICRNSLQNVSRQLFAVMEDELLICVGNPPYNDTTSIIRNSIKDPSLNDRIDSDIKTRDLGISFLLSYNKLKADYICVLHPFSYLIKKTNFSLLNVFAANYRLKEALIISSHEFSDTSRGMAFPILIGLYERGKSMDYDFIQNYTFPVKGGGSFRLSDFDYISNYVQKYPNKREFNKSDKPVAKFWTLRDINALKRNRTFIETDTYNTVYISMDKLPYYCYIDVFKQYADKMPYFIGNCDVIIDHVKFNEIKECFISESVNNNPILGGRFKFKAVPDAKVKVDAYFRELLSGRWGEKYAKNIC
jgi:hypothetical protein